MNGERIWSAEEVARLQGVELAGYHDQYAAASPEMVEALGITSREVAGADCHSVRARPGSILWNHAFGLGQGAPATEAALDEICAFYDGEGTQACIALTPDAGPAELEGWMRARGFSLGYAWRKFCRAADGPVPDAASDLVIGEIGPGADADEFGRIVALAFETPPEFGPWLARLVGRPGWRCFLARGL